MKMVGMVENRVIQQFEKILQRKLGDKFKSDSLIREEIGVIHTS